MFKRFETGVTLIELMITVAIIGILAAIAYPSYRQQVLRSNRTDAKVALMQAAQNLEKYFTVNGTYVGMTVPATSEHNYYAISLTPAPTASTYTVRATASGSQAADTACATLTINQVGNKTPTGCW